MGLSSAIDWWDEWKLRILVLCSLFVHSLLFFAKYVRQWYVLRRLRAIVWLAYIGGDALAIYALATLFNRQKQQLTTVGGDGGGSSNDTALEVVWASVLLIHLGGRNVISAYSLEDNELWKRHVITVVSQVTVALYVFCKWWSGEKRLLQAAVLLFIFGFLRCGQKPWALRRASYGRLISTHLSSPPRSTEDDVQESRSSSRWGRLGKWFTAAVCTCTDFRDIESAQSWGKPAGGGVGENKGTNCSLQLEEYVKEAHEHVKGGPDKQAQRFRAVRKDLYNLLLDLSAPYSIRLQYLQNFLNLDEQIQHQLLRAWIGLQFTAIYTKARSAVTCLGFCTSFLVFPSLALASAVLFANSDKKGYDKRDIMVTYILFFGTAVLELASLFFNILILFFPGCNLQSQLRWQDMVAQHNIMSFCARKKKPPTLMKLATCCLLRDFINKHRYISHRCEAQQISVLVRQHAEYGWKEYIHDAATYRRFNNLRGEHTLMKYHLLEQDKLGWTFNLPFDEYVLLWHIATNLCICQTTDIQIRPLGESPLGEIISPSEIISNHMIYLLFICPEMLIPGARQDLFILACDDIEGMIKDQPLQSLDEKSIAQRVFSRMEQEGNENENMKGSSTMIFNAYKLAKALIHLNNVEMRNVIQGVWVEILCYSASRCRGYLHAKSLANGGEFLTNVWVLWWCMGMQTLPDMMNNLGPPEELTAAGAASV